MPIINTVIQGGGSAPAHYIEKDVDANGKLINSSNIINFNGVTDIGDSVLYYSYYANDTISGDITFQDLTTISGSNGLREAFVGATYITSINFPKLTTISGSQACQAAFASCTNVLEINLPLLTTISGTYGLRECFKGNTKVKTVAFPSLTALTGFLVLQQCFSSCSSLESIWFYALTPTSFGSYTNHFYQMLNFVTGCTVHFPMAIQSTIGSWSDVTDGFRGTNTTVLFDIVTTLTGADSNAYTRKQKDSTDTATAWTYNDTLYYTSGTTEPQVGDTIYSDSACTTAVTTISSIA